MTLAFRKAERDDVPEIVRLLADDELGRTQEQGDGPIGGSYWNAFEAIDADPRQLLVVAEAERAHPWDPSTVVHHPYDLRGRNSGADRGCPRRPSGSRHGPRSSNVRDCRGFYEALGFVASHEGMKLHL